jgi:hypothetical protein
MAQFKEEKAREYLEWLLTPPAERSPKSKAEFAAQIGVVPKTLYNWEKMEWFLREVRTAKGPLLAAWYGDVVGRIKSVVDNGSDKDAIAAARLLMSLLELPEERSGKAAGSGIEEAAAAFKALGFELVKKDDDGTVGDEGGSASSEPSES